MTTISVQEVMQAEELDTIMALSLSKQAYEELQHLQSQLEAIPYDENSSDSWTPIWGASYSSRKFYAYVLSTKEVHPFFRELWKFCCTPRVKFSPD